MVNAVRNVSLREVKEELFLDCAGNHLGIGDTVAYNRSGNVVPGIIYDIKTTIDHRTLRLIFYIQCDIDNAVSKVRDSHSILLIKKG